MLDVRSRLLSSRRRSRLTVGLLFALFAATNAAPAEEAKKPRSDAYGDPLPPGVVMRLGTIRLRHRGGDVVFSSDGKRLISCGEDGEVRVWDAATGALLRRSPMRWKPKDADFRVRTAALSSEGATAAVWDHFTLVLFDTRTGKERCRFSTPNNTPYPALALSPDGKRVAVEVWDKRKRRLMIRLCNADKESRADVTVDPGVDGVRKLIFAPDGKRLAWIGFKSRVVTMLDAITGAEIHRPRNSFAVEGNAVAFSPDGKTLAVSNLSTSQVHLLHAATREVKAVLTAPRTVRGDRIHDLAFSPDGNHLTGVYGYPLDDAEQQGVLVWKLAGDKKVRRLPQRSSSCLRFSPDGKILACHSDTEICLWDVTTGRELLPQSGHDREVQTLAVSPDGRTLASCAIHGMLQLWDPMSGNPLQQFDAGGPDIKHCLLSPIGKHVITKSSNCLQVREIASQEVLWRLIGPWWLAIGDLGLSADGERLLGTLAPLDGDADEKIVDASLLHVWNARTGKLLSRRSYRMEMYTIPADGLGRDERKACRDHTLFSPDGVTMTVWQGIEDIASGCLLASLPKDLDWQKNFSPDGRLLLAAIVQRSDGAEDRTKGLALFEAASGDELFRWDIGKSDYLAFTSDGRGAIAADKERLRIWDTVTGSKVCDLRWPQVIRDRHGKAKISSLAVLPDGRIATGMMEGNILLWDAAFSTRPAPKAASDLSRRELDVLWSGLAGDGRKAQLAFLALAAAPGQVESLLRERLHPAAEVDGKRIDQWLLDLDSATFTTRETANRELAGLCDRIEPRLRRALRERPSLEVRRRLEDILAKPRRPSPERLRLLRAIAVLERLGTGEARRILEKLAGGASAPETRAAQAALQRLKHRDAWSKEKSTP